MSSFFDDFESNSFDPAIWQSVTGDVVSSSSHHVSGSYAAQLGGGGGVMTTVPFDATYCTRFRITFWAKRGPETPDNGDNLVMEYRVGTGAWTNGQTILGTGVTESSFSEYTKLVPLTPSTVGDITVRFTSNGTGVGFDHFFVDDFEIACGN